MEKFNYESIKTYQTFTSIEEMDHAIRGFLYIYKSTLSDGTLKVLRFIWRHSVKVIGVSFAKYNTIAAETELSRRTVIRAINKLEELGILKKVPTARMNGKQGVNLLLLQPFESICDVKNNMSPQDDTRSVTPIKAENKQSSLCENKQKRNDVRPAEKNQHLENISYQSIDETYLPESVHKDFIQAAKPFFHAMDIYYLWNRVLIAYKKSKLEQPLANLVKTVIQAFKQTIFMKKIGKIHSTFEGYFYGVVYAGFLAEKRSEFGHSEFNIFREMIRSQ